MKRIIFPALVLALSSIATLSGCGTMDKCKGVTCSAGQTCNATTGLCEGPTDKCAGVTCSMGQTCDPADGVCKSTDKCAGVTCSAGQTCDPADGICKGPPDKCKGVTCTNGQVCDGADGMCKNPAVPKLGTVIDRMGRPGVNTALTNPFDRYPNENMGDTTKDNYNADGAPPWAKWIPYINFHLGIFDALDGNCGNQLAAGAAGATRYTALATVLAGDALQLDSTRTACTRYLAVEANALGMANTDCGGRNLQYDVIDATYQVLSGAAAVTDGIAQTTAPDATFPFLKVPK